MKYINYINIAFSGALILFFFLRIIYLLTKAKFLNRYKMITTDKHGTLELLFYYLCVILVSLTAIYNRL